MSEVATPTKEETERAEKANALRQDLVKRLSEITKEQPNEEDKAEVKRREEELGKVVDSIIDIQKLRESAELAEFKARLAKVEAEPVSEAQGIQTKEAELKAKRYEGNWFQDRASGIKGAGDLTQKTAEFERQFNGPERQKVWATGDLEDVDLITPDIQAALPYLAAQQRVVNLCREIRTTSTSVEFPVFASGLTVDYTAAGVTKPVSDPTFELRTARVYTIAGTTKVPNSLLEDFAAARGWISSELGRATGVKEALTVLQGDGVGEPTGILNHSEITGRDAAGEGGTGRDIIETVFRAIQDVRQDGLTEPTAIVGNPAVWTDVVLSFESNIGYLYGPPQGSGFPEAEPAPRLLGLPFVLEPYVTTTYGSTTNQSPLIVGNFNDAVVLRRSPFRIDVDTSLGFLENETWFRGEERIGFIVVRPDSFKVVTNIVPSA